MCCSDADASIKNKDGSPPLAVAELNEQEAVVQLLKKAPAAKGTKDTSGKAPAKETSDKENKQDVYL